jgi:dipeptidyl aminopeptidase/acylaminoacyl peptidase
VNDPEFRIGDDGEIEEVPESDNRKRKPKEGIWQSSVPIPLPVVLFVGGAAGIFVLSVVWIFLVTGERSIPPVYPTSRATRGPIFRTFTPNADLALTDESSMATLRNLDSEASIGNQLAACETAPVTSEHRIVFSAGATGNTRNLFLSDIDGQNVCRLTDDEFTQEDSPSWSSDGSQIAFKAIRDNTLDIYVINIGTWTFQNLTYSQGNEGTSAWSPDGSQIAYTSDRDGEFNIFVLDFDGSYPRNINRLLVTYDRPRWSPDGTEIIFDAPSGDDSSSSREIFVVAADRSNLRRLTNDNFDDLSPAWSPDNSRIVFTSSRAGSSNLYIMNTDGTNLQQLPFQSTLVFDPLWISDDRIAFGAVRDGYRAIWVMDADGGNPRQVMLPLRVTSFDWLP